MKILFVVKDIDIEHLGIMLLSSILKQNGYCVDVVEAKYQKIYKKLKHDEFDILAYSCITIFFDYYVSLNRQIKRHFDIFSIFGGPHPTLVPEVIKDEGIDCICRGEGEFALLELLEKLKHKQPINRIKNLWVKENGSIFKNPLRPLVDNLDSLPFPDRELFPRNETFWKKKMHVITSRGCPYDCSYCCHPAYNRLYDGRAKVVRRRSIENVIEEIKQVRKKSSLKFIMFEDDLFVSSPKWINEFCYQYKREIGLPFFCYTRADSIDTRLLRNLKKAGCVSISMGLETASDRLRNSVLRRTMSKEDIINAARLIKKERMRLETTNIIGIPTGSLEDDIETLKLNIECKVDYSSVKLLMPYPETEIREFARRERLLIEEYPSTSWKSSVRFRTDREKIARENLRKLFAITVEFPFLLLIIKRVIYLPFGLLYTYINLFWEGYTAFFRLYPTGWRGFWEGVRKYINIFYEHLSIKGRPRENRNTTTSSFGFLKLRK